MRVEFSSLLTVAGRTRFFHAAVFLSSISFDTLLFVKKLYFSVVLVLSSFIGFTAYSGAVLLSSLPLALFFIFFFSHTHSVFCLCLYLCTDKCLRIKYW